MALKHRQNKSQKQRIIIFNCSPVEEDEKNLVKLAKKMKKTNISIDIVAFGELSDDTLKKLRAFNENSQSAEGSHLAEVQPSGNLLSDSLVTTPILGGTAALAAQVLAMPAVMQAARVETTSNSVWTRQSIRSWRWH